jgi:D-alanyl-D-alanine carboxypeptidase/D-alanyl-D-alanine-endopeptidase (penicillin-binding protein 4)
MSLIVSRSVAALAALAIAAPSLGQGPNVSRPAAQVTPARRLAERIDSILQRPALRQAHWGIEVREAPSGRTLFSRNGDRHFIPASNLKLLVSATAAHHLPADYRFRTSVSGTGPVDAGVLRGDLVLTGRGDPMISNRYFARRESVLDSLAALLRARGVRQVAGRVIADETWLDAEHVHGDWELYDTRWWYGAPVSALGFNDNSVDVQLRPGSQVGGPLEVSWEPRSAYVHLRNDAVTGVAGTAPTVDLERQGTGMRSYGRMPQGAVTRTEHFAVADPARYAGTIFLEALHRAGITTAQDTVVVVRAPAASPAVGLTPLAEHLSPPLPRAIGPILLNSQNWFAEQLLKTLGREVRGEGSWEGGIAVERAFLTGVVGIDSADLVLRDGSGLSAGNLVTPRALVQLLDYVRRTPRQAVVRASLPVSGERGSLQSRLNDLDGRVRAKTGYIGNVDSLSGYITLADGREVIFAIIANASGQPSARMKSGIDDIVRAVAAGDF